ncbi:NACHT, LRR and PYD domains-containing protein 3-like [Scomber japonicus]|uniref:NACHT, LRR and PYD domains-containing protein 3-like n=1 Tax=Scomber japonicus TaxID=13676 RepID=UPI002305F767|nr:NACHT, LRR and PYD domains-containing protein 3-like [Scomber japonicus]
MKYAKIPVNSISEIFKCENDQTVRIVLTTGEAGVGKSFHVQKFTHEWAQNANKSSVFTWFKKKWSGKDDLEVVFPLRLSELNLTKDQKVSLLGLLNRFFKETKESVISNYELLKVLFVLDGLDAFELLLDFDTNETVTDIRKPASVDVLLTSLIRGNLLPAAKLWITSRPSAAEKLPDECVNRKTQIREKPDITSKRKLKSQLEELFKLVSEWIDKQETSALLSKIFTDLFIIEGERGDVNRQSETRQVQDANLKQVKEETPIKYCDIFKPASGENTLIRTVLTIGVAGIGKTFASMKYMLDWAEGTANTDTFFTFPLPFRELNLRKDKEHSFEELIHQFFPDMQTSEISDYDKYKILIVLDGLDECRLDLDFSGGDYCTDVRKPTSVNVLLTSLIQGNLLPNAQIWITSRPAASNQIPADKVDRVTEVRGFNDEQKEEYFRKRFNDKEKAERIISHVKKSRSIYIMCHIPVFCWITAKVLEDFVNRNKEDGMPKTLTDMYIHFLRLQCRQANVKYGGKEADPCWNTTNKETILSLGKLALEELEKGNLLFTEKHLKECEINPETAVSSGLLVQIKREGCGLYQQKMYCFVHLSIQEFLAAFYVFHTFNNTGENLLVESAVADPPASDIYKTAVDKALENENGDWDLFLRFLLGLSLESNQTLLQELLTKKENNTKTNKETIGYIKEKIREDNSDADKNLNLFHCLNELNDHSLVEEVKKKYLNSETQAFDHFSASQWSALTFVLLTSDETSNVFDLKKYLKSEKVLLGMLPVVKVSETALLSWCKLSEESCKGLSSKVLNSTSANLTKLDLSNNDLLDSGVKELADGLKSHCCKLVTLKLSGCQVTEKGCSLLASALRSNTASQLEHLDLSYNHPGENGVEMLSAIAEDPNKKLNTLWLSWCELSEESCKGLSSSVLRSASSNLTELDLSHNDLLDSGVQELAKGLESRHCKLEILKLSGCQVTENGCSFLASSLRSNTASHLEHLDLSYNHPGENGVEMLSAIAENPNTKLKTLCLDHGGEHRLKPGLKKYCEDLRLDENTANRRLILSEGNRGVKTMESVKEKKFQHENKCRFKWNQVLCKQGLEDFCYWEVEWSGTVGIAVAYKDVSRALDSIGGFGFNDMSWNLVCLSTGYRAMHGKDSIDIEGPPSQKIAVFLDWKGGTLTYYSVTSGGLSHIHTFKAKFTKPLYPGFWFKKGSVTLCKMK